MASLLQQSFWIQTTLLLSALQCCLLTLMEHEHPQSVSTWEHVVPSPVVCARLLVPVMFVSLLPYLSLLILFIAAAGVVDSLHSRAGVATAA